MKITKYHKNQYFGKLNKFPGFVAQGNSINEVVIKLIKLLITKMYIEVNHIYYSTNQ